MARAILIILVLAWSGAADLHAQGRFRILVPPFKAAPNTDEDFGEDAAEALRELIGSLPTHQPVEEDEVEDALDRYDMDKEDLDCIRSRQLASEIKSQLALCASYAPKGGEQYLVQAEFWDVASGESFKLDSMTVSRENPDAAAQSIFEQFDRYQQQARAAAICADYAQSKQWDNALRNCDQALEINPESASVQYQRARILFELDRPEEAMKGLETVLRMNPIHEEALQLAGYISASQDNDQQSLEYYSRYLELSPGNAAVRMRIAYEAAQAGDPRSAMQLIQEGLKVDPNNTDLLEQFGGFAFAAGVEAEQASDSAATAGAAAAGADSAQSTQGISPEAEGYFRQAIEAYEKVFAAKKSEADPAQIRNVIVAYLQLGETPQAIGTAERAIETHPNNEDLWSAYADALERSDRLDDAIAALQRVREINPERPNIGLRQATWLLDAGRVDEARQVLTEVASKSPEQAESAAKVVFAEAYRNGVQQERFDHAAALLATASSLPGLSPQLSHQLAFWEGYSVFQSAVREQEPNTLESARATLPKFQRAQELLQGSGDYAATVNVNLQELLGNVATYIEIQQAIIKRGGG